MISIYAILAGSMSEDCQRHHVGSVRRGGRIQQQAALLSERGLNTAPTIYLFLVVLQYGAVFGDGDLPVSYTHLTLPTILRV